MCKKSQLRLWFSLVVLLSRFGPERQGLLLIGDTERQVTIEDISLNAVWPACETFWPQRNNMGKKQKYQEMCTVKSQ